MLYYSIKATINSPEKDTLINYRNLTQAIVKEKAKEANLNGPYNVRFYIMEISNRIIRLCANVGFKNKEKPSSLAKVFLTKLGFKVEKIECKEIKTVDFAEGINTSDKNGYIDDSVSVLINSTVGRYDDCVSSKQIEYLANGPFTIKALLDHIEQENLSASLKDELKRIFDGKTEWFKGHPVHYAIFADNYDRIQSIVDILVSSLFIVGRLKGRRYTVMNGESIVRNFLNYGLLNLFGLYRAAGGTTIVTYPLEQEGEVDEDGLTFSDKLSSFASDNRHKILTIIGFKKKDKEEAKKIISKMDGMTFVEINDERNTIEKIQKDLVARAGIEGFSDTNSLLAHIVRANNSDNSFSDYEVNRIYSEWVDEQLETVVYPQYSIFRKSKVGIEDKSSSSLSELNKMIGLKNAKDTINRILGYHKAKLLFNKVGVIGPKQSYHMAFLGDPGTAKTTVARLYAKILKENGILSKGDLIEVGRKDLIGRYVGWTDKAVANAFQKAKGSVLFIDEAYSLCDDRAGSYGDEAINTIVQLMENNRDDTVVIFAGYTNKMEQFLDRNEGLRSRIPYHIVFENYSVDELTEILKLMTNEANLSLSAEAEEKARKIFAIAKESNNFGNGRFVRNIFEHSITNLAYRVSLIDNNKINKEKLITLRAEDFEMPVSVKPIVIKRKIGF